jgi:hypothetical protein
MKTLLITALAATISLPFASAQTDKTAGQSGSSSSDTRTEDKSGKKDDAKKDQRDTRNRDANQSTDQDASKDKNSGTRKNDTGSGGQSGSTTPPAPVK